MATYTGTARDDRAAGEFDRMYGLGGNDTLLSQWKGRVYLDGGDGYDDLRSDGGAWGEFYGGAGNDWIRGGNAQYVDTILGGDGDDAVWGDLDRWPEPGAADLIDGGAGRDVLNGGAGNDTIYGGDGDDSGDEITAGTGGDLYWPGLSGGGGDDHLDGGTGNDEIWGDDGNDTLIGGSGNDIMIGGDGDDTYFVDSVRDIVAEDTDDDFPADGTDVVIASVDRTLGVRLEKLILTGAAVRGTGNDLDNMIVGSALGNVLDGGEGADTLSGGLGNDRLVGGAWTDRLLGGAGNDTLLGGLGRDAMTGGAGKDMFVFGDRHTGRLFGTVDTITDFSGRGGDRISVKAVDANALVQDDQAFAFIGTGAFTAPGQLRYAKTATYTYVYFNTDADYEAEAVIKLKGVFDLSPFWFVL